VATRSATAPCGRYGRNPLARNQCSATSRPRRTRPATTHGKIPKWSAVIAKSDRSRLSLPRTVVDVAHSFAAKSAFAATLSYDCARVTRARSEVSNSQWTEGSGDPSGCDQAELSEHVEALSHAEVRALVGGADE
jgi:hypothetical protein